MDSSASWLIIVFPVFYICIDRGGQGDQEEGEGADVDESGIEIQAGEGIEDEFDIGVGHIDVSQLHAHLVVPFRAGAKAESVPYSQDKPGESGHKE